MSCASSSSGIQMLLRPGSQHLLRPLVVSPGHLVLSWISREACCLLLLLLMPPQQLLKHVDQGCKQLALLKQTPAGMML